MGRKAKDIEEELDDELEEGDDVFEEEEEEGEAEEDGDEVEELDFSQPNRRRAFSESEDDEDSDY
jgi:hypothetical protein